MSNLRNISLLNTLQLQQVLVLFLKSSNVSGIMDSISSNNMF